MKKVYTVVIIILITIIVTSCKKQILKDNLVTITDMLGDTITIPKNPKKVACVSRTTYDLLVAFGLSDKIDGAYKNIYDNPWLYVIYPDAKNEYRYEYEENYETFLTRKIDLVFAPEKYIADGSEVEVEFLLGLSCENLSDGKNTYSFMYGPYVLSARLGTQKILTKPHGISVVAAAGRSVDSDEITVTSEKTVDDFIKNIDKYLIKRNDEMEFDLKGVDKSLVFTTHYNQYVESYGIYWRFKA